MDLDILPPGIDPWKIPALMPPPGVQSNFLNPESHANQTILACSIVTAIMIVFLFARMYTKIYLTHSVGWDDYVCIFASLLAIAYLALITNVYQRGFGVHQWNFPIAKMTKSYKEVLNGLDTLYGPAMFFTKLSLLLLYFRLFSPNRTMRWLIYFGIGFNFVLYTIYLFAYIFVCPSTSKGYVKCQDQLKVLSVSTSSFSLFSDFYMLFLPLFAVSRLQLEQKRRLGLIAIFLTGFLACLAGVLGLIYRVKLNRSEDHTWTTGPVVVLTDIEVTIGIIVSCMPTLPALFRKSTRPSFFSKSSSSKYPNSNSGSGSGSGNKNSKITGSSGNNFKPAADNYQRLEEEARGLVGKQPAIAMTDLGGSDEARAVPGPGRTWLHS